MNDWLTKNQGYILAFEHISSSARIRSDTLLKVEGRSPWANVL
jgi:hypothetical protein